MFYNFELMMAGAILLTAMAIGGITLWIKRRKKVLEQNEQNQSEESQQNF